MAKNNQERNSTILVPTDFTPVGQNAIEHAVSAGELLNFKVVILHVINRETKAMFGKENTGQAVEKKLK